MPHTQPPPTLPRTGLSQPEHTQPHAAQPLGQLQHAACDLEVTLTSVLCAGSTRAEFLAGGRLKIVLGWVRFRSFLWPPRPGMVQAHALSSPLRC